MARKKKVYPDVLITDIGHKGQAIGRDENGVVYFVQDAVPGDLVDVLVLRKKKSFRQGIVSEYKKLSDERIEARCEHFGQCGGCKWQNLDYTSQLKYKEKSVKDAFSRLGHIDIKESRPIIGCEDVFYYRNKLEYSFSTRRWVTKEELATDEKVDFGQAVGFHKAGHFDKIVPVETCHLQENLSNDIRNYIRDLSIEKGYTYYNIREHHGLFRNLIVRNTSIGEWMLIVIFGEEDKEKIEIVLSHIKEKFPQLTSLQYVVNQKMNDTIYDQKVLVYSGQDHIKERLGHVQYKIGAKSFFQTNSTQAKVLYDKVVECAQLQGHENVYDLYTGLGSIALYIADKCKQVIGIEEIADAISDARENMKLNHIHNAIFEVGDVKDQFNSEIIGKYGAADVIIVDPPRPGLHADVVQALLEADPDKIVYVSCNPATQARDIALMQDQYSVELIQPVDMFPHTHHIENIALLKRK